MTIFARKIFLPTRIVTRVRALFLPRICIFNSSAGDYITSLVLHKSLCPAIGFVRWFIRNLNRPTVIAKTARKSCLLAYNNTLLLVTVIVVNWKIRGKFVTDYIKYNAIILEHFVHYHNGGMTVNNLLKAFIILSIAGKYKQNG